MVTRIAPAAVALAALGALTLGACSSTEESPLDTCATPPADEATADFIERCGAGNRVPEPSEDQQAPLLAALDAIAPGLADEPESTLAHARGTCSSILDDAPDVRETTIALFSDDGVSLSADQADEVVDLIRAETWCE